MKRRLDDYVAAFLQFPSQRGAAARKHNRAMKTYCVSGEAHRIAFLERDAFFRHDMRMDRRQRSRRECSWIIDDTATRQRAECCIEVIKARFGQRKRQAGCA